MTISKWTTKAVAQLLRTAAEFALKPMSTLTSGPGHLLAVLIPDNGKATRPPDCGPCTAPPSSALSANVK